MTEARTPQGDDRRPLRRRRGDTAEALVAAHLERRGWVIVARQLRIGRDELDLLAIEPGRRPTLVVVEVRSRADPRFGPQEERLDAAKVGRLYRAAAALRRRGALPDGSGLPALPWRIDLIAVDPPPAPLRHLRGVIPA